MCPKANERIHRLSKDNPIKCFCIDVTLIQLRKADTRFLLVVSELGRNYWSN